MIRTFTPFARLKFYAVVSFLAGALLISTSSVKPAYSFTLPPCEATECPAGASAFWPLHSTVVLASLAAAEYSMSLLISVITDAIVRLANASTQDTQAENLAESAKTDKNGVNVTTAAVGERRAKDTLTFAPSVATCSVLSNRKNLLDETNNARTQLRQAEGKYSSLFSNDTSTPAATGQLGYLSDRFATRMQRYCNSTTTPVVAPISCNATIGVDYDLKPYETIFAKTKFSSNATTNPEYIAAQDLVLNLIGNNVSDPVRNQALERPEGKNLNLVRYSQQAKLSLANGALLQSVERRRSGWLDATKKATFADMSMDKLAESTARGGTSQTMDTVALLIGESSKQLMTFYTFMEQWTAIKAVALGIDIQENSAQGSTSAGTAIIRQ